MGIQERGTNINLVVAYEVLRAMHKKKGITGWFALKVDLKKAYDRLEWNFVRECLSNHHLDNPSIELIMNSINKAASSIMINGKKYHSFHHSRGLRQGDLMSPFIFNICLQHLTSMINHTCHEKTWSPFEWGR